MTNLSWLPFERCIDHPNAHWNAVNSVPYLSPRAFGNDHHAGPEVCVLGLVVAAKKTHTNVCNSSLPQTNHMLQARSNGVEFVLLPQKSLGSKFTKVPPKYSLSVIMKSFTLGSLLAEMPDATMETVPPPPSPHSVQRRIQKKCPHGKTKTYCTECGGKSVCEHGKQKAQ